MKSGDLSLGASQLHDSLKKIHVRWETLNESWQDPVSAHFCEDHIDPLEPLVFSAVAAMNQLAQVIAKCQQECQ